MNKISFFAKDVLIGILAGITIPFVFLTRLFLEPAKHSFLILVFAITFISCMLGISVVIKCYFNIPVAVTFFISYFSAWILAALLTEISQVDQESEIDDDEEEDDEF